MPLTTRKPSGRPPWPLILVEGEEKAGKSWCCAELSTSARVGTTYWIDIGEGAADEYGAIQGARYEVVEHDGTWPSILGAVAEIRTLARRAADVGEPPTVVVIDTITAWWELLKDWTAMRARNTTRAKERLQADPHAEIAIPINLWNDATNRNRRLMNLLMTFPGIAVVTARGKDTAVLDVSGKPIPGQHEHKVEGHKTLAHDVTAWVRLSRDNPPALIEARSVHTRIKPGADAPKPLPGFTLERLVFDVLHCGADTAPRALVPLGGDPTAQAQKIRNAAVQPGATRDTLDKLYRQAAANRLLDIHVPDETGSDDPVPLRELITRKGHAAASMLISSKEAEQ